MPLRAADRRIMKSKFIKFAAFTMAAVMTATAVHMPVYAKDFDPEAAGVVETISGNTFVLPDKEASKIIKFDKITLNSKVDGFVNLSRLVPVKDEKGNHKQNEDANNPKDKHYLYEVETVKPDATTNLYEKYELEKNQAYSKASVINLGAKEKSVTYGSFYNLTSVKLVKNVKDVTTSNFTEYFAFSNRDVNYYEDDQKPEYIGGDVALIKKPANGTYKFLVSGACYTEGRRTISMNEVPGFTANKKVPKNAELIAFKDVPLTIKVTDKAPKVKITPTTDDLYYDDEILLYKKYFDNSFNALNDGDHVAYKFKVTNVDPKDTIYFYTAKLTADAIGVGDKALSKADVSNLITGAEKNESNSDEQTDTIKVKSYKKYIDGNDTPETVVLKSNSSDADVEAAFAEATRHYYNRIDRKIVSKKWDDGVWKVTYTYYLYDTFNCGGYLYEYEDNAGKNVGGYYTENGEWKTFVYDENTSKDDLLALFNRYYKNTKNTMYTVKDVVKANYWDYDEDKTYDKTSKKWVDKFDDWIVIYSYDVYKDISASGTKDLWYRFANYDLKKANADQPLTLKKGKGTAEFAVRFAGSEDKDETVNAKIVVKEKAGKLKTMSLGNTGAVSGNTTISDNSVVGVIGYDNADFLLNTNYIVKKPSKEYAEPKVASIEVIGSSDFTPIITGRYHTVETDKTKDEYGTWDDDDPLLFKTAEELKADHAAYGTYYGSENTITLVPTGNVTSGKTYTVKLGIKYVGSSKAASGKYDKKISLKVKMNK